MRFAIDLSVKTCVACPRVCSDIQRLVSQQNFAIIHSISNQK